ncbi:hypothetical protein NQZ68_001521 [Dissostichus eleginoides]|nr:hypothetical protein NQZ68_001521 [Dissostichus eleginoides]
MTTLLGPINSQRLLEHQVMANQALKLRPGLTVQPQSSGPPGHTAGAAIVLYQLQLTTSQVGLRDILDHEGAASSLSASSLLPDSSPRPR